VGSSSNSRFEPRRSSFLAARQVADLLLLVGAGEIEAGDERPGVHLAAAHFDRVVAAGDFLEHGFVGRQRVAVLIDVTHFDRGGRRCLRAAGESSNSPSARDHRSPW
jgi:hypothetical protein